MSRPAEPVAPASRSHGLLLVEEALSRVLSGADLLPGEESAPLRDACGRVLAGPIEALRTQPPVDVSSMDGYAVSSKQSVTPQTVFTLVGESAAGSPFGSTVGPGQTARIFTGAHLPAGTDAVIAQEDAKAEPAGITFVETPFAGKFVRRSGLDFRAGEVVLSAGVRLRPVDVALAAAAGHAELPVARRPRVGILATGDELARPGEAGPGDIINSNTYSLLALVEEEGGTAIDLGIARDTARSLADALHQARSEKLDVLVTLGGASVGDYDLVRPALIDAGLELGFWRIAMRPGRPLLAGRLDAMRFLGLPGNPVSAMVCALVFLVPLLRRLQGIADCSATTETASLARDMPANDGRQDYVRAQLVQAGDLSRLADPFPVQDSSMLRAFSRADCLIVRAPFAPAAPAGDLVPIIRLR